MVNEEKNSKRVYAAMISVIYYFFFNNKILEMENKFIGCQSLGTGSGKWGGMRGYKRTTEGFLW